MLLRPHRAFFASFVCIPRVSTILMTPKRKASASPTKPPTAASPGQADVDAAVPPPKKRAPKKSSDATPPDLQPSTLVYDPHTMRPPALGPDTPTFSVLSWNVAGLRALLKKQPEAIKELVQAEHPDVICLQEHKLQDGKHCDDAWTALKEHLPGWHVHWNCSKEKKGYSGTAIFSKSTPLSVEYGIGQPDHDGEGRVVSCEFDKYFVVNVYVPNSGEGLKRLDYRVGSWDVHFSEYLKSLEERGKPVIVTGDLNCAAQEIDIHSPKTNLRSAGFTIEERESFASKFLNNGFVDCFRRQHPSVVGYTYWGYRFNLRAKNKGWRLDYFLVSQKLADSVHDCYHLPYVMGSDHCPLGLIVNTSKT